MTETGVSGDCRRVAVERQLTAVVKVEAPMNALPEAQRAARRKISAVLPTLEAGAVGNGITLWRPSVDGRLPMEPGVIVARDFPAQGEVVPSSLPAGRAAQFVLKGSYEGLPGGWRTLLGWCKAERLKLAGINWEIYGPWTEKIEDLETTLYALLG